MEAVTRLAPAKINLALDILGERADGYHEMRMVMQTVSLCDTVTLREAGEGFSLDIDGNFFVPVGRKTLEQRAAEAFFQELGRPCPPLCVTLKKRTPAYAGLGGGSADVASLLALLRDRYAPEKTTKGAGLYSMGKDEDGNPVLRFDSPDKAKEAAGEKTPKEEKEAAKEEQAARQAAEELIAADPELKKPSHRLLKKRVRELFQENGALFS